jgi:hypothetical protein
MNGADRLSVEVYTPLYMLEGVGRSQLGLFSHVFMIRVGLISFRHENQAKGLEAQGHHLISLGGWIDVMSIYLSRDIRNAIVVLGPKPKVCKDGV